MLKAQILYIFLFLIVVETIGLLLLKRGLEISEKVQFFGKLYVVPKLSLPQHIEK